MLLRISVGDSFPDKNYGLCRSFDESVLRIKFEYYVVVLLLTYLLFSKVLKLGRFDALQSLLGS